MQPKWVFWSGSWVTDTSGYDLDWIWEASCLVQRQYLKFYRAGCIWLRIKSEVRVLSVLNPVLSLSHHHTVQPIPSSYHKYPWESALHTFVFLPAEPHQQNPYNQQEPVQAESDPSSSAVAQPAMGLSRAGSSSWLQLCCLRVAESDSPFAARLYLFFIRLCFKKKKKLLEK